MYAFEDLLEQLPNCGRLFPLKDIALAELRYVDEALKEFISPSLSVIENGHELSDCHVLIISAPGAVGKSTLSETIAVKKEALLLDLAPAGPVGDAYLDGILYRALGGENVDNFREFMANNLQFVIIDALDEGRIKVTEDAFLSFLKSVSGFAQGATGICFVLLGRTQVADLAWLALAEENVTPYLLAIEPFNRDQAHEYINKRIDADIRTPVFENCRDLIFDQLAFSVNENLESNVSEDFLHYPPVLDVVVALLSGEEESNLHRLENELRVADGSIDLLQKVMTQILQREQSEKFLPNFKSRLGGRASRHDWSYWDSLYTPEEQCQRLLGKVLGISVSGVSENMPEDLMADYEESVSFWLPQHPFLEDVDSQGVGRFANSVFESYLYSRALRGDFGDDLRRRVTDVLLVPRRLPTRLLADFYLATDSTTPGIMPEHLGILYDSLLSSETNRRHLRLTIDGSGPLDSDMDEFLGQVEGEFEFLTFTPEGDLQGDPQLIPFSLVLDQGSKISFARYIRDASITVPCTIEFGDAVSEFQIGPAVFVNAMSIVIKAESLIVGGRARLKPDEEYDSSVVLQAITCDSTSLMNQPTVYEKFSVSWTNDEMHPWHQFRAENVHEAFSDDESLHRAYMRFKRIATTLRSHRRGSLARTERKIEHHRVLQGAVGEKLLERLISDRILSRENGIYFWNSDEADVLLGVSWGDLRKGETPQPLRDYLSEFIRENPTLF